MTAEPKTTKRPWNRGRRAEIPIQIELKEALPLPAWLKVVRELLVVFAAVTSVVALYFTYTQLEDQRRRFYWERRTNLLGYLYSVDSNGVPVANEKLRSEALLEFVSLDPLYSEGGITYRCKSAGYDLGLSWSEKRHFRRR